MLTCKQAAELLSQEMDRPLGHMERFSLRLHLMICSACTNYRRQLAVLRSACRRISGQ